MAEPLRVAVIGGGNMGRHHVRNYAELPESDLVAVADFNPAVAELAAKHGAKYFSDYREMLEAVQPEAVTVAVPTNLHLEIGEAVMSRGIHTLMDKPIAASPEEADRLIKLAQRRGLVFTVGHIERFNPIVRRLKALIDEGALGNITSVVSKRVGGFPNVEPKTDVIVDLAVHDIDIISFLLGQHPESVNSHGSRTLHSHRIDSAEILLHYGRASGFIQANWITPVKVRTIAVTGSGGYVEGNYITQELIYYKHNMQKTKNGFKEFVVSLGEAEKKVMPVEFEEPLAVELRAFLQTIQGDVQNRLVSPNDAREALVVALKAIHQSEVSV